MQPNSEQCPSHRLEQALRRVSEDEAAGLAMLVALIEYYPADARLHFLQGSLLAQARRYEEARAAVSRAVELQPDFTIARFELGLLELMSGDLVAAETSWSPLLEGPPEDPLRLFAEGLSFMVRDDFTSAAERLRAGIARKGENEPLSQEMQRILESFPEPVEAEDQPLSLTQLILQQRRPGA